MKTALTAIAAAALIAGCGSSGGETSSAPQQPKRAARASGGPIGASVKRCTPSEQGLRQVRVSGVTCEHGGSVSVAWVTRRRGCAPARGSSRSSCSVQGYRCLSARAAEGVSVNCSRQGRSISFLWKR